MMGWSPLRWLPRKLLPHTVRLRGETGQGLVEYSLVVVLVAAALVIALGGLGTGLLEVYGQINAALADLLR